jgi:hypothetical protein
MSNEADTQEHDRWERLLEPIESRLRGAEQMYMELFREESRRWHKEVGWTRAREPEMRIRLARLVPNLEPLLAGVVQPADFVKRWIESVEKRVPDSQVLFETSPVIEESPLEPEEIRALRKRRAFDLAVAREDLRLRAWLGGIAQRHVYRTAALFVANVLVLLILLILRSSARSAIGSAGELLYVSVLLVFPTISLFVYSQFLHWTHLAEQEGKTYQTRLAAATHAYETYEMIQQIRQRATRREGESERRLQEKMVRALEWDDKKIEAVVARMVRLDDVEAELRQRKAKEMRDFLVSTYSEPDVSERAILKALDLWVGSDVEHGFHDALDDFELESGS